MTDDAQTESVDEELSLGDTADDALIARELGEARASRARLRELIGLA